MVSITDIRMTNDENVCLLWITTKAGNTAWNNDIADNIVGN